MKCTIFVLFSFLLVFGQASAQHQHTSTVASIPVSLMQGLGDLHHPVSTKNPLAQRFFDQGLTLVYAFNHEEAIRSFKRAAELDPQFAMAYWGIALALGPNINMDVDAGRENAAYEAVRTALSLSAHAPENERAYISALAKRYSIDPKADLKSLAGDYKNEMGELAKRYPDDLDAATLYAESLMDLRPWQFWSANGKPAEGTEEIVAVLESVLKRDPRHIGANHYYIHTVEASPHPEWALASAQRLKTLAPAAGHLVHMPAHIFARVGDYETAAQSNIDGAAADLAYFKNKGVQGMYPVMYYTHNLHFLAVARSMEGRSAEASKAAEQLRIFLAPYVKQKVIPPEVVSMLDYFSPTPILIMVCFHRWEEVLKLPEPDRRLPVSIVLWHFARGSAFARTGKVSEAESELRNLVAAEKAIPSDTLYGLNGAGSVLKIAENVLTARISLAKGDRKSASKYLRIAVDAEDALNYDEPPGWYMPVRETLGGVLMSSGDYAEADRVFRADLEKHPRNGRSLFGLVASLKAQGKQTAAQFVQNEFDTAWKGTDTSLRVEDF